MASRPAPEPRSPRRRPRHLRHAAALGVALLLGCQPTATTGPHDALSFDDTPLEATSTLVSPQTAPAALHRLDRLLDLFDAARFSGDPQLRDAFWTAIGEDPARTEGPAATRNAVSLLLDEAYALEDRGGLEESGQRVLAEHIQLLATDLHRPTEPEDQQVQTLVYRQLALEGSPRVADNAAWRLYDFVRGTADAAVRAPAERRPFIVSHAQLAIEGEMGDPGAPPSAQQVESWLEQQREQLEAIPRWQSIAGARSEQDAALIEALNGVLPAPRFDAWSLYPLPAALTKQDSLAPLLLVSSQSSAVDPMQANPRNGLSPRSPEIEAALRESLARDGRGIVMVACDPNEPAALFSSALELVAAQAVDRIELAVRQDDQAPVRAMPLVLARPGPSPGSQAFLDARLRLHLDGATVTVVREPRDEGDGALAGEALPIIEAIPFLEQVAAAFPEERAVALTVSRRVSVSQLLDVLVVADAAGLGTVGLVVDGRDRPEPSASGELAAAVSLRTRLVGAPVVIDQPYPLPAGDQKAVEAGLAHVGHCLGELGVRPRAGKVGLKLSFEEGDASASFSVKGVGRDRVEVFERCSEEVLGRVRLQEHRDRYEMRARWTVEK